MLQSKQEEEIAEEPNDKSEVADNVEEESEDDIDSDDECPDCMYVHDKDAVTRYDGTEYKEEGNAEYFRDGMELADAVCDDCNCLLQKKGDGTVPWKKLTKSKPVQVCIHRAQGCHFCLCHDCFSKGVIAKMEKDNEKGGERKTGRARKVNRKYAADSY